MPEVITALPTEALVSITAGELSDALEALLDGHKDDALWGRVQELAGALLTLEDLGDYETNLLLYIKAVE